MLSRRVGDFVPAGATLIAAYGAAACDPRAEGRLRDMIVLAGCRGASRRRAGRGTGAMVGAGIFALLGAAGEVAGAAVWLSFLLAGVVAVLQGYSFAKLGARYPSAGGCWSTWPRRPATATSPGSPRG